MPPSPIKIVRVLLIDVHAALCTGLRALIESEPYLTVIGEARGATEALANANRERPAIILLNLNLDNINDLDLLPELQAAAPGARVVVLTGLHDPEAYYRAVRLGAMGIVLKEQVVESLTTAIKDVDAGRAWLDGAVMAQVLDRLARAGEQAAPSDSEAAKIATLTKRELEIIALVSRGLKNQQIADRLFISEGTVRNHLTIIFSKLELSDRCELIAYAYQHRLTNRYLTVNRLSG
jgi:DNA-binding NarL/FixJ family response regulator